MSFMKTFILLTLGLPTLVQARILEGDGTRIESTRFQKVVVAESVPEVRPTVSQGEVRERLQRLPAYANDTVRQSANDVIAKDIVMVKAQKPIVESRPGREGDSTLKKTKSGVAVFDLVQKKETKTKSGKSKIEMISVSKIPLLDIGDEPMMSRSEWQLQNIEMKAAEFQNPKALDTPALMSEKELKTALAENPETVNSVRNLQVTAFGPGERISFETVSKITMNIGTETPIDLKETKFLTAEEIKMLKANIILENNKKCHLAAGLLTDLTKAENTSIRAEANYHLAICLHQMGLYTESIKRMKEVIKTTDEKSLSHALRILTADLPKEFEEEISTELKKVDDKVVPLDARDDFHYIIAKASSRQGHYNLAFEHADKVTKKYKKYPEAQYIMAVSEYSLDRRPQSLERQKKLKEYIDQNGGDKNLRALVSLNLGRISFQEKKYKEAIESYSEIKKDHPLWIEALIEQGWTQLLIGDSASAIGNMYSIHSPYFKSVYQPESFVVRTIGYLNICQYGDAYKTLSQLEQKHRAWLGQIQGFRKNAKTIQYYEALVKYLKAATTSQSIEGLPYQVLREIGRHRDFLNVQEAINARIDELDQYDFINTIVNKDKGQVKWLLKKSKERIADLTMKLKKADKNPEFAKNLNQWKSEKKFEEGNREDLVFELQVYEDSHKSFLDFKKIALNHLQSRKKDLQMAAGDVLKDRMKKIETRLVSILDNNELLRYETFAGSGENIRFHAAGGTAGGENSKRIPRTAKPESKALQWNFDGEFWEDEIGHYRSGLKDNCPERKSASITK